MPILHYSAEFPTSQSFFLCVLLTMNFQPNKLRSWISRDNSNKAAVLLHRRLHSGIVLRGESARSSLLRANRKRIFGNSSARTLAPEPYRSLFPPSFVLLNESKGATQWRAVCCSRLISCALGISFMKELRRGSLIRKYRVYGRFESHSLCALRWEGWAQAACPRV